MSAPSLKNLADARLIPLKTFEDCGFKQGARSIEIHYQDEYGNPGRIQLRNYDLLRPKKNAFSWQAGSQLPIIPFGINRLFKREKINTLFIGEGASDGITAAHVKSVAATLGTTMDNLLFGSGDETPVHSSLQAEPSDEDWMGGFFEVKFRRIKK